MPFRSDGTYSFVYEESRASRVPSNQRIPEPLSAPTKKLFQAIDDENLEDFKRALAEGVDVNAFDEEGMTPLMSIVNGYAVSSYGQHTLEEMAKLLIQNRSININAQSKQSVYEERQKRDSQGRKVFQYLGREIVCQSGNRYMYCDDKSLVKDDECLTIFFTTNPLDLSFTLGFSKLLTEVYDGVKEEVRTFSTQKNTALHIACQVGAKDMVKMLLTHPDVKTDIRNCDDKSPEDSTERSYRDVIKLEFKKAQKEKELLVALSDGDIDQAKALLERGFNEQELIQRGISQEFIEQTFKKQEFVGQIFNPNCWKRTENGEIETPLSLIIKSCLEGITEDKKEVLVKLLKHKELDFSQIKSMPAIEQLGGMNNIPVDSTEQFVQELVGKLEKIKAQPTEKDRKLNNTREESNERIHRIGKESDGRAISPNRKQNNYALTFFILCGICAVGACLTIVDYSEISAGLAAIALGLFLVWYFLYKGDEKDIGPSSATDNPQVTSVFISSPNSAESFYTY